MNDFILEMEDISIEFPGVKALDGARFEIRQGEVQALIGANGAGKSTLMKILSGAYSHWTGKIRINGSLHDIRNIKQAKDLGIEIVYQEVDTALFPGLTVMENLLMEEFSMGMGKKQFINWPGMKRKARENLKRLNVDININKKIEDITLAEKQMILIARAVSRDCKLLILDEPQRRCHNLKLMNCSG
jgi:simple sugar transport system ATP-binding protein